MSRARLLLLRRVLIDGDTADEQPDGTILAKNKKTYLFDDNGEPLGARFYDAWITADGKVVRKGKLKTAEEVDYRKLGIDPNDVAQTWCGKGASPLQQGRGAL